MSLMFQRPISFAEAKFYPYKIDQSCRFNDDDTPYSSQFQAAWSGFDEQFCFSTWVKRCNLGKSMGIFGGTYTPQPTIYYNYLNFDASDQLIYYHKLGATGDYGKMWARKFRDVGSWYHILFVYNSDAVAAADRIKLFVNGIEETDVTTDYGNPPLGQTAYYHQGHSAYGRYTGAAYISGWYPLDGYLAETRLVQGNYESGDFAVTDFGQFKNGIWIPKQFTKTYTGGEFYLDYSNSSHYGEDQSGLGNDFTDSGLVADDQVEDSPTNNYPTLNPVGSSIDNIIFKDGNLIGVNNTAGRSGIATIPFPKTGKWYVEFTCKVIDPLVGIVDIEEYKVVSNDWFPHTAYGWGYRQNDGDIYTNGASTGNYGDSYAVDEVMAIVFDADAGTLHFYNENVDQGEAVSGLTGQYAVAVTRAAGSPQTLVNFGQLGFTYTPPTGYKALCSNNISTPTIKDSSTGFDVILYEGDGATPKSQTGLSFQPDLVWAKCRTGAVSHGIVDSVRGTGAKVIHSDGGAIENNDGGEIDSFDSGGFTTSVGSVNHSYFNANGYTYVAWCFRMGAKYGFDIQTYVGTGVAHAEDHNLSSEPELIIVKNLDVVRNWIVYHHHALNKTDPETDYGVLDTNSVWNDNNTVWNDTAPTSTQFTVGTSFNVNENTKNFITYLWRSIEGFSKVFSYTGNGNANGPFVYCRFRPRYVLIKKANTAVNSWYLYDTERNTYNPITKALFADLNSVEEDSALYTLDILSNGFKIRNNVARHNTNGALYVGIAYAEQSGKWSNAR